MEIVYDPSKGDFGLEVSIPPHAERPADVFASVAGLIRAFEETDRELANTIDPGLAPKLILETFEVGSLRTWFVSLLRSIPDEDLRELKVKRIIGALLVKAKHKTLRWLERKRTIEHASEIEDLREDITTLRNEVERLRRLPVVRPVPLSLVVNAVKRVSVAVGILPSGQGIKYISAEGTVEINRSFHVTDEQIEHILTKRVKTERRKLPLTIKRPDYIGTSMWDVFAGGHIEHAKIIDDEWLERFHERKVTLLPGDALLSDLRIESHLDDQDQIIDIKYVIERVHDVVRGGGRQLDLFDS